MGIKLLGFCHQFDGVPDAADTIGSEMLECYLPAIAVEVHTAVSCGIAVSRQCVVGAAGIVACALTGIGAEENAAGIDDFGC